MNAETFRKIAPTIPHQPGVYKYFDEHDHIIYVGKAKDLRKRVSSYFNKTYAGYKTHELVQRIVRIEFNVVDTAEAAAEGDRLVVPGDAEEVAGGDIPQADALQLGLDAGWDQRRVLHLRVGRDDDIALAGALIGAAVGAASPFSSSAIVT